MSLTILSPSSHNNNMLHPAHPGGPADDMAGPSASSRVGSWVSDNHQPIPWSQNDPASSSRSSLRPPSSRARPGSFGNGGDHHLLVVPSATSPSNPPTSLDYSRPTSTSILSIAMGGVASRSRVSMDALPAEETHDLDSVTPSSSTTSLPDQPSPSPPAPPSQKAAAPAPILTYSGPQPVGLGLPTFIGSTGRADWPLVQDISDEAESDDDDEHADQQEMETYQSTHRAPVDAALRSVPGVVALGDGWAGGAKPSPKRRWFRRNKGEDLPSPVEDDPLALWNNQTTPTPPPPAKTGLSPAVTPTGPTDPNAKWWRSRKNLFASQRNLNSLTHEAVSGSAGPGQASETRSSPTGKGRASGWANRSRLFGSMVDLGRHNQEKRKTSTSISMTATPGPSTQASTPTPTAGTFTSSQSPGGGNDSVTSTPKAKAFARHSMTGLIRNKAPPHPLELLHQNKTRATSSQPVIVSASSSQPTFFPSPSLEHPLLRTSYARSESHLAGGGGVGSPGIPPPRPVVDNGPLNASGPMPSWRPPFMSPTKLVEVEEEEEEEEPTAESTTRPPLQRTATFGDDEDNKHQLQQQQQQPQQQQERRPGPVVSQAPALETVEGSPHETQKALSFNESMNESNSGASQQPSSFLGRIKNALSRGGGKTGRVGPTNPKTASIISGSTVPASPRSYLSDQPLPTTPTRASLLPPPRSVGHQGPVPSVHRRSRLFSMNRKGSRDESGGQDLGLATKASSDKRSYRVSKHVVESMINLSPSSNSETFGRTSPSTSSFSNVSPNPAAHRRTSWAAPVSNMAPRNSIVAAEDEEIDPRAERRHSRVSLRRFKSQSKQRPQLGSVFPRPPDSVEQPPSLHWAFPGSYSTPMLHKFGGSTLSLALDISSTPNNNMGLDDIAESPRSPRRHRSSDAYDSMTPRERALSATIASLTGQSPISPEPPILLQGVPTDARGHRNSIPVNIDNLTNSSDSLALPNSGKGNMVNFPLPPSTSADPDLSSPDVDQVEQLRTPQDSACAEYYRSDDASDQSSSASTGSTSSRSKAPSWSTCKTSSGSATGASLTPIATPTSMTSAEQQASTYQTARGSFSSSLLQDAAAADDINNPTNSAAAAYMAKATASMAASSPARRPIVA